MRALVYDTETSGLPLFSQPSEDPNQPHIVQLAAMLVDIPTRRIIHSIDLIVRPDGWGIEEEALKAHGITVEYAKDVGISEKLATDILIDLWDTAEKRIAHNESFDARIVRIALMRHGTPELANEWKAGEAECTQVLSTPILKLPPTEKMRRVGRNHYKSANLREAYQHFMGKPLQDAHSAMADCRACLEVYYACKGITPIITDSQPCELMAKPAARSQPVVPDKPF